MGGPLNVGIVGCGSIIAQYLETIPRLAGVRLRAVADIDPSRALAAAEKAAARGADDVRALTVAELLADDGIDAVVNLTTPAAHASVALQAIDSNKSVYGEKPLAATTTEGRKVLDAAAEARVQVGCAPDTVLGTGVQTARRAIDDGLVGRPIAATATMVTPGHERWHPNPDFYYVPGGGPLLDMGPYYVSALVTLLGPVASVLGAASHTRTERTIRSGPRQGERIPVSTDTHVTGVLVHESGVLSTLVMSFDAAATESANIEVHGEKASLVVPDPNQFAGEVRVHPVGADQWRTLPVSGGYRDAARGFGLADMAVTPAGTEPRAGGTLAYHVLDVMESLLTAAECGRSVTVESSCRRPDPVPLADAPECGAE